MFFNILGREKTGKQIIFSARHKKCIDKLRKAKIDLIYSMACKKEKRQFFYFHP